MRLWLALLCLAVTPVLAADWGHYENARFGFAIDVPPGFRGQGEGDNGDGNRFATSTAELKAYGGNVVEASFDDQVRNEQHWATDEGWAITYQVTTPRSASFSGKKGARILYERLVAICNGTAFAGFRLEYSRADLELFSAVIDRLVTSLKVPPSC